MLLRIYLFIMHNTIRLWKGGKVIDRAIRPPITSIYRGTTPTIVLDMDVDLSSDWNIHVYIANEGNVFDIDTVRCDKTESGSQIKVILTQEQTLELRPNTMMHIQVRAKHGETVMASEIAMFEVKDVLKDVTL